MLRPPLVLLLHRLVVACCFASVTGIIAVGHLFGRLLCLRSIGMVVWQTTMPQIAEVVQRKTMAPITKVAQQKTTPVIF
jgi:hypothetical protein